MEGCQRPVDVSLSFFFLVDRDRHQRMVTGEGGGRNGRMIKVAGVLGATMLLLAVVCLREGADNGVRSVLEGGWSSFRKKAPEIQLAERSSSVSGSSSSLYG